MKGFRLLVLIVLSLFLFQMFHIDAEESHRLTPAQIDRALRYDYVPGEILVKFKDSAALSTRENLHAALGVTDKQEINYLKTQHIRLPATISVRDALQYYLADETVEYAEPNYICRLFAAPNDPDYSRMWGHNNTGQTGGTADADIDLPASWDSITYSNAPVAVIDTGIAITPTNTFHPDLTGNIWINSTEQNGIPNFDDDFNGYKDDIYGWDFYSDDSYPEDNYGHGTHVSGIIAACGNNGIGAVGVLWQGKIMALKVGDGSLSTTAVVSAINYAANNGARVINASFGTSGYSSTMYNAIIYARTKGVLFVAAAGNGGDDGVGDNNDTTPLYPASYDLDNIIAVAATDHSDQLATFSNYGVTSVDLGAPGVDIYSTLTPSDYGNKSGTSMAAPYVCGVAALVLGLNSALNYTQVKDIIFGSVDKIPALTNKCSTGGRLNASFKAKEPTGLSVTPISGTRIDLGWTDNAINETGYRIERKIESTGSYVQIGSISPNITTFGDVTISKNVNYYYRVCAFNAMGNSLYSNEASGIVIMEPPTNLVVALTQNGQVSLAWQDKSDDEQGFRIERKTGVNGNYVQITTVGVNTVAYTDSATPGALYYYRVRGYKAAGPSPYSNEAYIDIPSSLAVGSSGTQKVVYKTRCFIATAAYGSADAPRVVTLRKFRDKHLLTNHPGRALVWTYERISPPVADIVSKHETLKKAVRFCLQLVPPTNPPQTYQSR